MIENLRQYFDQHVPVEMQKDIIRHIYRGYKDARQEISGHDYSSGPARNLFPYTRWCKIDDYCLALNKYPGFETNSEENAIKNTYYTLIKSPSIKLTISAVKHTNDIPRESKFRNDHASCQYRFNENNKGEFEVFDITSEENGPLYAFIIHGPADNTEPYTPGFIYIAFPDQYCKKYIDSIDLCAIYPEVVAEMKQEGMEHIEDKAKPELIINSEIQQKLI